MLSHPTEDTRTEPADIHAPIVPKLLEAALLAARSGEPESAKLILDAVEAIRPNSTKPAIVRAMAALYSGWLQEAVDIITGKVLPVNPANAAALSLLGLAEKQLGNSDRAHRLLSKVVSLNDDPQSVSLAKTLLES